MLVLVILLAMPEDAGAMRGGFGGGGRSFGGGGRSFGGSRSSGGSRSFGSPRTSTPQKSFGGTRSSAPKAIPNTPQGRVSSFGGNRMSSGTQYTQKYGTPRRTETRSFAGANGVQQNYVMHSYGGYGSGLMTGYMLGHTPWMWSTPFHPAFYYGRPYYVTNPDGGVEVYPPTFSYAKLFFTLIIVGAIIFIIYVMIRGRKSGRGNYSQSSFS